MERIDAMNAKAARTRTRVAGLAAVLILAACSREPGAAPPSLADSVSAPPAAEARRAGASDTLSAPADTAEPAEAVATPDTTPVADTAPRGAAAPPTALDSLRLEVRRLSETVQVSTRSTDSVLRLLREGALTSKPAESAAAAGAAGGGRVLQDAAQTARSYGLRDVWPLTP